MERKPSEVQFIFFGTPRLSVYVLDELEARGFVPQLIVAAPDKPQGRGMKLKSPPTKEWALKRSIEVMQPAKLDTAFVSAVQKNKWDLFIVAAYGKILPEELLSIPRCGTLNVHPSLLPRWRGPSPIQAAILHDDYTGVSIMQIDKEMDHGPIVVQQRLDTDRWPEEATALGQKLFTEGGRLLADNILPWLSGEITPREQDHLAATYCKKIQKDDGLINLTEDPKINIRKIKAFSGRPGAYFFTERLPALQAGNGKRLRVKITEASLQDKTLVIERVIPEGKGEMSYDDFLRGN